MKLLNIILLASILVFSSCSKEDDNNSGSDTPSTTPLAEYEIKLDGEIFDSGKDLKLGMIKDSDGNWANVVTIESNGINTTVNTFPKSMGEIDMSGNGDPGLVFYNESAMYNTTSGTLTRVSETEISFSGTCVRLSDSQSFSITGFVKSEDLKVIVE